MFPSASPDEDLRTKDINTLSRAAFYTTKLMSRSSGRMEYDFAKEAINQMARNGLRRYEGTMGNTPQAKERTVVHLRIGQGFAWTKYNRPLHFLSVVGGTGGILISLVCSSSGRMCDLC